MLDTDIEIPPAWERLSLERLRGTLMIVGNTDVGKSTFARYLYRRLCADGRRAAFLDGDPGQSALGPPTTMTAACAGAGREPGNDLFPPDSQFWRWFVGDVTPTHHLLPVVIGATRLTQAAYEAGAETVIYDTTGLIEPASGGTMLKLSKIDLLRPAAVFAIQRTRELEHLMIPLRRSQRVRVIDLTPSAAVRPRDMPARQAYRAARFARYFAGACPLPVNYAQLAVLPPARLFPFRLVALENAEGLALGLGIVLEHDPSQQTVTLLTPLAVLDGIDVLHPGDIMIDPETFRGQRFES